MRSLKESPFPILLIYILSPILLVALGNYFQCEIHSFSKFPVCSDQWKLSQFVIDYREFGFIRRGFVASILNLDNNIDIYDIHIRWFCIIITFIFGAQILFLTFRLKDFAISLLIIFSPATFLQIGLDIGRLDYLNYVIAIFILASNFSISILLAPLLVFIHEGSLLMQLPIIFYVYFVRFGFNKFLLVSALACMVAAPIAFFWGEYPTGIDIVAMFPNIKISDYSILNRSLRESMLVSQEKFQGITNVFIFKAALASAYAVILTAIFIIRARISDWKWLLAFVIAYSPLLLSVVAIDWGRWFAQAIFNVIIVYLIYALGAVPQRRERSKGMTALIALAGAFTFLGPMGVLNFYPTIRGAMRMVAPAAFP